MPPPASGRRKGGRRETTSSVQPQSTVQTPSRKRRKVNGNDAENPPNPLRQSTADTEETVDNGAPRDGDAPEQAAFQLAEEVIRHLTVSHYTTGVTVAYNNDIVQKSVQAYAKIAGRDWTYYVTSLRIILGRPKGSKPGQAGDGPGSGPASLASPRSPLSDMTIDIDLGPDQQISRLHSEIYFDSDTQQWLVIVNGRNGLHLDNLRLERGQKAVLHSGSIINILGTQMIFLLPVGTPIIHPEIRRQLLGEEDDMSDPATKEYQLQQANRQRPPATGSHSLNPPAPSRSYAAEPSDDLRPDTPLNKKATAPGKSSPTYRGVMMESAEDIDYAADSAKDMKPPHSYAALIGQAILATSEKNATLAKIYDYIRENYAYFRYNTGGWQNSIRHNLSLSKSFEKIPRRTDEPGKGMKWRIVPDQMEEFIKKNIHPLRRLRQVGSSGPNSPSNAQAPSSAERLISVMSHGDPSSRPLKRQRSITPSPHLTPNDQSYTPPTNPTFHPEFAPPSAAGTPARPERFTPSYAHQKHFQSVPENPLRITTTQPEGLKVAFQSPPTLTSSQYDLSGPSGSNLFTPLPARSKPFSMTQSTAKVPSFYARELFSSPAPFWRYVDIGSTPAKLPDMSPSKPAGEDDEMSPVKDGDDIDDADKTITLPPQPSSPPVFLDAQDDEDHKEESSPTSTVSRLASVEHTNQDDNAQDGKGIDSTPTRPMMNGQPAHAASQPPPHYGPLPTVLGMNGSAGLGPIGARNSRGLPFARMDMEDDDDDGAVDLTK
jgi:hypothetical protein